MVLNSSLEQKKVSERNSCKYQEAYETVYGEPEEIGYVERKCRICDQALYNISGNESDGYQWQQNQSQYWPVPFGISERFEGFISDKTPHKKYDPAKQESIDQQVS